jgi:hypothetical protein
MGSTTIAGPAAGKPRVSICDCYLGGPDGPDVFLDVSWLGDVKGLESVEMNGIRFHGGHCGREEILPLVEGRTTAIITGCRICYSPVDGSAGAPGVCPDELSFRCVLSS